MTKAKIIQFNINVNLTAEMTASEWRSRVSEKLQEDESDPEEAALAQLAEDFDGEELCFVPGGVDRAWIAGTDTGLASII